MDERRTRHAWSPHEVSNGPKLPLLPYHSLSMTYTDPSTLLFRWYLILFVLSVAFGLATVLGYPSQLPWWAYFVSNIIALVFTIPCCKQIDGQNANSNHVAVELTISSMLVLVQGES